MCKLPKKFKTKYSHKDSLNSIDTVTNKKYKIILETIIIHCRNKK